MYIHIILEIPSQPVDDKKTSVKPTRLKEPIKPNPPPKPRTKKV